jgi:hypothetical protein
LSHQDDGNDHKSLGGNGDKDSSSDKQSSDKDASDNDARSNDASDSDASDNNARNNDANDSDKDVSDNDANENNASENDARENDASDNDTGENENVNKQSRVGKGRNTRSGQDSDDIERQKKSQLFKASQKASARTIASQSSLSKASRKVPTPTITSMSSIQKKRMFETISEPATRRSTRNDTKTVDGDAMGSKGSSRAAKKSRPSPSEAPTSSSGVDAKGKPRKGVKVVAKKQKKGGVADQLKALRR